MYGLSWKEIRVDVWGFWVVVGMIGFSWEDVGEDFFGGGWLAILEMCLINLFFSGKTYVYCNILR